MAWKDKKGITHLEQSEIDAIRKDSAMKKEHTALCESLQEKRERLCQEINTQIGLGVPISFKDRAVKSAVVSGSECCFCYSEDIKNGKPILSAVNIGDYERVLGIEPELAPAYIP